MASRVEVVLGRPEPAGHEHDVGPTERDLQHLDDPRDVVADRLVVQDVDPDRGEPFGDPPRVGVGDLTEQQLGPDADDLGPHVSRPDGVAPSLGVEAERVAPRLPRRRRGCRDRRRSP